MGDGWGAEHAELVYVGGDVMDVGHLLFLVINVFAGLLAGLSWRND